MDSLFVVGHVTSCCRMFISKLLLTVCLIILAYLLASLRTNIWHALTVICTVK